MTVTSLNVIVCWLKRRLSTMILDFPKFFGGENLNLTPSASRGVTLTTTGDEEVFGAGVLGWAEDDGAGEAVVAIEVLSESFDASTSDVGRVSGASTLFGVLLVLTEDEGFVALIACCLICSCCLSTCATILSDVVRGFLVDVPRLASHTSHLNVS